MRATVSASESRYEVVHDGSASVGGFVTECTRLRLEIHRNSPVREITSVKVQQRHSLSLFSVIAIAVTCFVHPIP